MSKKYNVPKSWFYSRTRTGQIPHYKIGKYVRFDEDEVMEWIKKQQNQLNEERG
jgi:excisionase family DNA binding protein